MSIASDQDSDCSPKIKILRVITRLNVGGPAQHAVLLTSGLDRGNFESTLVIGKPDNHEGNMSFLAKNHEIRLVQIDCLSNGSGLVDNMKTIWRLYRVIKKENPYLVHLHLLKARFFGGLAAKMTGIPLVIETFHGNLFTEYYGFFKTAAIVAAERFLGWSIVDRVITISKGQKRELLRYRICPERKIHVIPLGLDLGRFVQCSKFKGELRKELGLSERTILIGTVGRLVPIKGLNYLLDAIRDVAQSSEIDFRLLIIGDGLLRKELESRVSNVGVEDRVTFLGWRFDLERIYADLDIVVLTSLNEGTPVSLIEAMAAGKAVVATRVGGVPDVVKDGATGLLVPSKDPVALADAILRLFKDERLRNSLGTKAKGSVYPKYDVSRLIEDMKKFYLDLVGQSDSR